MQMKRSVAVALATAVFPFAPLHAEPFVWGVQVEQLEYRVNDDFDIFAWDFDAFVGDDDLRVVWRSEAEYDLDPEEFETMENQARIQVPISAYFDAVLGARHDTPAGPNRSYGVIGLHGLAPQWFEIDADLFLSNDPVARFEAEYEGLITNRVILIPSVELDLPLSDDEEIGAGAFGPKLEVGARLSYDLVDRLFSPYIGVHYERLFGDSKDLAEDEGESADEVFFVVGARIMF